MSVPGLVIAAARSGSGKTILTLGLMRALGRRGLRVVGRKNGPDYIDPAFHAAVTGRPSLNLDSWAMPGPLVRHLAAVDPADADLALCEGSMGLFDGVPAPAGESGSSADVAALTGWPVVLVHDCSGQSQTAAALLKGCALHDPRVRIAGVVLNRIASERHRRLVADAVAAAGLAVFGALPRSDRLTLPERHLGLVQAGETVDLEARVEAAADVVAEHVDLDALIAAALPARLPGGTGGETLARESGPAPLGSILPDRSRPATPVGAEEARRGPAAGRTRGCDDAMGELQALHAPLPPPGQRIAVARDEAFSFLYPHVLDGWRRAGADILFFSPLADEPPDLSCDACWLPGGYPELHAGRIAAAERFLAGLRALAGIRPVHGECGGYMVLGETLADASGAVHAMAGLLGVATSFASRKLNLGYRDARLSADGPLGPAGTRLRGHEFHYATVVTQGRDPPFAEVRDAYGAEPSPAGSRRGYVTGSFFHALAVRPEW